MIFRISQECFVFLQKSYPHPSMHTERKIIHIDMDAFYASVEQRDHPELRGKPIAVGHAEKRGVVAAASYEARKFGVRSAMSSQKAKKLCPQLIFVEGRMEVYKSVSAQIHEIFHDYTDLIERCRASAPFCFRSYFLHYITSVPHFQFDFCVDFCGVSRRYNSHNNKK